MESSFLKSQERLRKSCSRPHPEPGTWNQERERTFARGDSAKDEPDGLEKTGIPEAEGKVSRAAQQSGKPSKGPTESASLNKSDIERDRGSTSLD